jgi:hypothetical protein
MIPDQVFYRLPWTRERVEFMAEWWPHFGTYYVADKLRSSPPTLAGAAPKRGAEKTHARGRMGGEWAARSTNAAPPRGMAGVADWQLTGS